MSLELQVNTSVTSAFKILNQTLVVDDSNNELGIFKVNLTVPNTPIESHANFTVTLTNNRESLILTEDNLTNNIFVDTISPKITL